MLKIMKTLSVKSVRTWFRRRRFDGLYRNTITAVWKKKLKTDIFLKVEGAHYYRMFRINE